MNWTSNNAAFGSSSRLALSDEELTIRAKPMTTLVALEAFVVPLSTNGGDDYILLDGFLATHTFRCCTARVAMKTPRKTVLFDKWGLRVKWLRTS